MAAPAAGGAISRAGGQLVARGNRQKADSGQNWPMAVQSLTGITPKIRQPARCFGEPTLSREASVQEAARAFLPDGPGGLSSPPRTWLPRAPGLSGDGLAAPKGPKFPNLGDEAARRRP